MDFKKKTNWIVITGAPSSGKTSVILDLESRGMAVQPEVARAVIERKLQAGLTLERIRADNPGLQREILAEKQGLESALDPAATVFLDRGMGDSVSYFRLAGMDTKDAEDAARLFRYRAIFVFDRLPMIHDAVRNDAEADARQLDRDLETDYRALGYTPVRVPVMPVAARADFILERL